MGPEEDQGGDGQGCRQMTFRTCFYDLFTIECGCESLFLCEHFTYTKCCYATKRVNLSYASLSGPDTVDQSQYRQFRIALSKEKVRQKKILNLRKEIVEQTCDLFCAFYQDLEDVSYFTGSAT